MHSYAAALREVADSVDAAIVSYGNGLFDDLAPEELRALADLLERVTPEVVNAVHEAAIWYPRHRALQDALDILRALATGPQGEVDHG